MREFLDQFGVLQQHGAARAGGDGILIVGDRRPTLVVSVGLVDMVYSS